MRVFPIRGAMPGIVFTAVLIAACSPDEESITAPTRSGSPTDLTNPAVAAASGICDYDASDASFAAAGWTKDFDETFSTGLSQWSTWYGGAFNNELQLYQAANLQVAGGALSIIARQETATGPTTPFDPTPKQFAYTSGRIESRTHFSASRATPNVRLAARLKLPSGYGMWPAFWSYGDPWPTHGEIDIVEARGQDPFTYYTAYWYGRRAGINLVQNSSSTIGSSVSLTSCWHVYEVIWSKNDLTYLFDGQVVDVKSGGYIPSMFRKQQRITLNVAVGGLFFPNFDPALIETGTLQADWVKVFVKP
ncbi:MAG: glycoside hydrolase family 16 protein [Gemmatimonadaceae bacterium]